MRYELLGTRRYRGQTACLRGVLYAQDENGTLALNGFLGDDVSDEPFTGACTTARGVTLSFTRASHDEQAYPSVYVLARERSIPGQGALDVILGTYCGTVCPTKNWCRTALEGIERYTWDVDETHAATVTLAVLPYDANLDESAGANAVTQGDRSVRDS